MNRKLLRLFICLSLLFLPFALGAQPIPPMQKPRGQSQSHPHSQPPFPPIIQDFPTSAIYMNLGAIPIDGINLSGDAKTMAEGSSISIVRAGLESAAAEVNLNSPSKRFMAVSDLYEIKVKGMNQYFALPVKYAILAKEPMPLGSRLFFLARLGSEVYFIPATTTNIYGMFIAEINSCAIYDKVALVADSTYYNNYMTSYFLSASLDSKNKPINPYHAKFEDSDGFGITAHIFPAKGRSNARFNSQSITIIQPGGSSSLSIYKYSNNEKIFVQNLPFISTNSYSFCQVDLANFERYYDDLSISHAMWLGFENTNIEDIPSALIFRATCRDSEGTRYATEDQLIHINTCANGYNSPFSGGNGSSSNPYIITNVSQLDKIRDYRRRFFRLNCDLDLNNYQAKDWLPLGDDKNPFDGFFDGNYKSIRNLKILNREEDYQGLFGCIKNGSIRNLSVDISPDGMSGKRYCGILAGFTTNTRIYQCYSSGNIKANNYAGGLIGYCSNTSVRKSMSNTHLTSTADKATLGGLIGYAQDTTITDCHTTTEINASGEKASIGGIGAQMERVKLQNCYSTGILNGSRTSYTGGLAGYMNDCETKGSIALNKRINGKDIGRIAGTAKNSSFARCFAWNYIRDTNNKNLSEGGFGGTGSNKADKNGEDVAKNSFYGSKTRNKFWTQNKKLGFNLGSWIFNSGYNLPQLRHMPSLADPDYLK